MKDFLDDIDRQWNYRRFLMVIAAILGVLFLWSAFSHIDQHVRGTGKVVPSGKLRTVQHLEGGIVRAIKVKEGDQVQEGQELFLIENSKAESSQQELQLSIQAMQVKLLRLAAERDGTELVLPPELTRTRPEIGQAEQRLFGERQKEFQQKIGSYRERVRQKELQLENLAARRTSIQQELNIALEQLKINSDLLKAGAISQSRYLDSQSRVSDFRTRITEVTKEIPVAQAERAEAMSALEEARQSYRAQIADEMRQTELEQRQLQERLSNFSDQVARTSVKSPIKGIVNARHVNTVGGVIQPGAALVDIIPIDETLVIEGRIGTDDRAQVYPGLPVTVRISAYDYAVFGSIKGELADISADSVADSKEREFYRVRVKLDAENIPKDMKVVPGMAAELHIISSRTTVLRAVLKPLLRLGNNAFKEV